MGGGLVGIIGGVLTDSIEVAAAFALAGMVAGGLVAVNVVGFDGAKAAPVEPQPTPLHPAEPVPMTLWAGTW